MGIIRRILIIGGTGGIGSSLSSCLYNTYKDIHVTSSSQCDITNRRAIFAKLYELGPDVVIVCAGVNHDALMHKTDERNVAHMVDVNITGSINVASACMAYFRKKATHGRLIFMSSILSEMYVRGTSVYSASKAFLDKMVQNTAIENATHGITCNSIQLGYFDAGMTHRLPEESKAELPKGIPAVRLGQIQELSRLIETIIETPYINGANIKIAGGL